MDGRPVLVLLVLVLVLLHAVFPRLMTARRFPRQGKGVNCAALQAGAGRPDLVGPAGLSQARHDAAPKTAPTGGAPVFPNFGPCSGPKFLQWHPIALPSSTSARSGADGTSGPIRLSKTASRRPRRITQNSPAREGSRAIPRNQHHRQQKRPRAPRLCKTSGPQGPHPGPICRPSNCRSPSGPASGRCHWWDDSREDQTPPDVRPSAPPLTDMRASSASGDGLRPSALCRSASLACHAI